MAKCVRCYARIVIGGMSTIIVHAAPCDRRSAVQENSCTCIILTMRLRPPLRHGRSDKLELENKQLSDACMITTCRFTCWVPHCGAAV